MLLMVRRPPAVVAAEQAVPPAVPLGLVALMLPAALLTRAVLEERLRRRAQDPDEVIAERMKVADNEISHYAEYDYVIVNDDIDRADGELRAILTAERLRRHRRAGRAAAGPGRGARLAGDRRRCRPGAGSGTIRG